MDRHLEVEANPLAARERACSPSAADTELVLAWRRGDPRAFGRLVQRHHTALRRFLARHASSDAVDDLVQAAFVGCVESDGCAYRASFRAYLWGIARNKLLMHWRERRTELDRGSTLDVERIPEAGAELPSSVEIRERRQRLTMALRHLDRDLRRVLELFYWEDRSTAQIASELQCPLGTIHSRLDRARRRLREELAGSHAPRSKHLARAT